jgi:hypothetical protein
MKKALLLFSLIGLINFSFAQSVSFGVKAGVNFSNISSSGGGLTLTTSNTTGLHVGAVADIGFANLSLQPGILYSTKGGSSNFGSGGADKLTLNYVEVPVNLLYNIPVGIGKVFIGGGPYVALGVSGKSTLSGTATSTGSGSESQNITFGSASGDVKNPDFGVNLLGGFRFKSGLSFSAGYGIGLANLSNESGASTKNNVLSFSIGYFF